MNRYIQICEKMNNITHCPMALVNSQEGYFGKWPALPDHFIKAGIFKQLFEQFHAQKGDRLHPIISYIGSGYLYGICQLEEDLYLFLGLTSPIPHTRQETMEMCSSTISPFFLEQFCDYMVKNPLFTLTQMKDLISLLMDQLLGIEIPSDNILFDDAYLKNQADPPPLSKELFYHMESATPHIPVNFETAVCNAITAGNQEEMLQVLTTPSTGRVGQMSSNELRQQKYTMICMATLASRAAISGGLSEETAFSISDSYCYRADQANSILQVQNLIFAMLLEYVSKVREGLGKNAYSRVIQECLNYISIHLHDAFTQEMLAAHCKLCSRSLSLRFRKELGMSITEYIHREKIREGQYLLRRDDYTLSEIAYVLGYPSQSYFTQIFKKYCGQTPQQYRDNPGTSPKEK